MTVSPATAGFSGSATWKDTSSSPKWTRNTSPIISTCTASARRSSTLSKASSAPFNHLLLTREAMQMILRCDSPDSEDLNDPHFLEIYQSAMDLYGVIHARFILSPHGLAKMREKFMQGAFGTCPRVLCERQHVLPIGVSEELSTSRVKVYCPRCHDVYLPR